VTQTVYTIEELKEKLEPIFKAAPIKKAILFGSYAKGLQTATSDIDIVIDSEGQLLNINFYGVLEDVTETLGKRIDLIEIAEIRKDSSIYNVLQKEGVVLYDK